MNIQNIILVIAFIVVNSITVLGQVNQTDNESDDPTKSIGEHWIAIGNPFPDNITSEIGVLKYQITLDEEN